MMVYDVHLPGGHNEKEDSKHDLYNFLIYPLTCTGGGCAIGCGIPFNRYGPLDSPILHSGEDIILAI